MKNGLLPSPGRKWPIWKNTRVLETRRFRFYCGCTLDRILPTLKTLQDNREDLFQGEEELEVTCPRCAAIYRVTKENLED